MRIESHDDGEGEHRVRDGTECHRYELYKAVARHDTQSPTCCLEDAVGKC
jgi:hypothetical protein